VTGPSSSTPPSPRKIFSSDLCESHGLAGLGWGGTCPPWLRHCKPSNSCACLLL